MTTVNELLKELQKLPKDLPVVINTKETGYEISFSKIEIESKEFQTPFIRSKEKQKFIVLNQKII